MTAYHRSLIVVLLCSAPRRRNSPPLAAAQDIDPREHQNFADDLTAQLYSRANECSSALGVSMAFSLVYPGCTGDAIEEVRATLRYPAASDHLRLAWERTAQRMLDASDGRCVDEWGEVCRGAAPLLKIANRVWFDDGAALDSAYAAVVGDYAHQIDFEADESPRLVNEWVSDATEEMIDSIVPEDKPLFPSNVLIAINSIYLKASWKKQFEEHSTNLDWFYSSVSRSTEVSEAHFMHAVERFAYSHEALPGYQVLDLPFDRSQLSMVFVLPMIRGAEVVLSTDVIAALDGLQSTRVALSVPKFKFESEYEEALQDALVQLGIKAPFKGSGALCGLFEDEEGCDQLTISSVVQKTVIDVNEKGVEAAAVTSISVGRVADMDIPILMLLDHPFQFFIYDEAEGLMLFEGRLGAPEVPAATPATSLLDARHADDNFWSKTFYVDPIVPAVGDATTSKLSTTQPACSAKKSCEDCLVGDGAAPSPCAYAPVAGCLDSCNMIADAACYSHASFAKEGFGGRQICAAAAADEADARLCGTKGDCASCTGTVLLDGTATCRWFSDGDGFCGSECGMIGCGDATCDVAIRTTGAEEASGSSATQPTVAASLASSGTTSTSEPPATQPTETSDATTTEPVDEPDPRSMISSGNMPGRAISSHYTGIFLAFALVFIS